MPLTLPPRDAGGNVVPHDHDDIANDDQIVRRISIQQTVEKDGKRRLSSLAFQPSGGANGGMSIDIVRSIQEANIDPKAFVTSPRWIGSVVLTAGVPRGDQLLVGFEPIEENPHHGEIWGSFTRAKSRRMMQACAWFVPIPDVELG